MASIGLTCGLHIHNLDHDLRGISLEDLSQPGVQVVSVGGHSHTRWSHQTFFLNKFLGFKKNIRRFCYLFTCKSSSLGIYFQNHILSSSRKSQLILLISTVDMLRKPLFRIWAKIQTFASTTKKNIFWLGNGLFFLWRAIWRDREQNNHNIECLKFSFSYLGHFGYGSRFLEEVLWAFLKSGGISETYWKARAGLTVLKIRAGSTLPA